MLFDPIDVAGLHLRNRIMRSATHECLASTSGFVTDDLVRVHEELADGGTALIVTGYAFVVGWGKATPQQLGIHSDECVSGLARLAEAAKSRGAAACCQIVHAGRQVFDNVPGARAVCPSAIPDTATEVYPAEITQDEIEEVVGAHAAAAGRARRAGFDAVQIHCAHGFLLSSFLSPYTNRRHDQWGGPIENRVRIVLEIIRRTRAVLGSSIALFAKVNSEDALPLGPGISEEDFVTACRLMAQAGIDMIEVSGGMAESGAKGAARTGIRHSSEEAYFAKRARRLKSEIDIPVALVGGLRSQSVMEELLQSEACDIVSLSRPLICEPALPEKMRTGKATRARCISCNGCFDIKGYGCVLPKMAE